MHGARCKSRVEVDGCGFAKRFELNQDSDHGGQPMTWTPLVTARMRGHVVRHVLPHVCRAE